MLSKTLRLSLLLGLFAVLPAAQCWGDEWSWSTVSDNGSYRFAYVVPAPIEDQILAVKSRSEDPPYFTHASEIAEIRQIQATYSETGMYRNDGSATPIWTTSDPYAGGKPSPDGRRVVHFYSHHGFAVYVCDNVHRFQRSFSDNEALGLTAWLLLVVADGGSPYLDDYTLDPTWEHLHLT